MLLHFFPSHPTHGPSLHKLNHSLSDGTKIKNKIKIRSRVHISIFKARVHTVITFLTQGESRANSNRDDKHLIRKFSDVFPSALDKADRMCVGSYHKEIKSRSRLGPKSFHVQKNRSYRENFI